MCRNKSKDSQKKTLVKAINEKSMNMHQLVGGACDRAPVDFSTPMQHLCLT